MLKAPPTGVVAMMADAPFLPATTPDLGQRIQRNCVLCAQRLRQDWDTWWRDQLPLRATHGHRRREARAVKIISRIRRAMPELPKRATARRRSEPEACR